LLRLVRKRGQRPTVDDDLVLLYGLARAYGDDENRYLTSPRDADRRKARRFGTARLVAATALGARTPAIPAPASDAPQARNALLDEPTLMGHPFPG
jgi:hypothetical protein